MHLMSRDTGTAVSGGSLLLGHRWHCCDASPCCSVFYLQLRMVAPMTAHVPEKNRAAPPAMKAPAVDTATAAR
jgi:hypothetical protein